MPASANDTVSTTTAGASDHYILLITSGRASSYHLRDFLLPIYTCPYCRKTPPHNDRRDGEAYRLHQDHAAGAQCPATTGPRLAPQPRGGYTHEPACVSPPLHRVRQTHLLIDLHVAPVSKRSNHHEQPPPMSSSRTGTRSPRSSHWASARRKRSSSRASSTISHMACSHISMRL